LVEVNKRLKADVGLQRAFGRTGCAEQSVVQDTLDACTAENVVQLHQMLAVIIRRNSQTYRHDYQLNWQVLDADMTWRPCGLNPKLQKSLWSELVETVTEGGEGSRAVAAQAELALDKRECSFRTISGGGCTGAPAALFSASPMSFSYCLRPLGGRPQKTARIQLALGSC
jgi:hypothetical protein